MQSIEIVSGYSDLKTLLVRTYKIDRPVEFIRLFFSESQNELLLHDYDDHKKIIHICYSIKMKDIRPRLSRNSNQLILESLNQKSPAQFLNDGFKLYGFFRS
jgi:hypothetical protein